MFIIDFDDTLFDTHAFKRARLEAMGRLGVEEELFWKTYAEARNNAAGNFVFTDERHADIIARHGFAKAEVLWALRGVNNNLRGYFFPDATPFLEKLKQNNQKAILLSLGEENFQKLKLKGSGIENFFYRIYTVDDTKQNVMKEITRQNGDEEVWFINDKIGETKQILNLFPTVRAVLRMSKSIAEKDYMASGIPYIHSLSEIFQYVG